jgi:hypothetical protein
VFGTFTENLSKNHPTLTRSRYIERRVEVAITEEEMKKWWQTRKEQVGGWLRMGISPRRLALTLALGFAIGCLPLVGIPTALCMLVAVALRLNVPAIQAANYAAMPLQLILIWPFVRLGGWMFSSAPQPRLGRAMLHGPALQTLKTSGSLAGEAVTAWVVIAAPAVLLLTIVLTAIFRRVPALAAK